MIDGGKILCPNCKSEIKNSYKFCPHCRAKLEEEIPENPENNVLENRSQVPKRVKKSGKGIFIAKSALATLVWLVITVIGINKGIRVGGVLAVIFAGILLIIATDLKLLMVSLVGIGAVLVVALTFYYVDNSWGLHPPPSQASTPTSTNQSQPKQDVTHYGPAILHFYNDDGTLDPTKSY